MKNKENYPQQQKITLATRVSAHKTHNIFREKGFDT